ncbi:MAG: hypothetical protein LBD92_02510 [Oscillospiraceae bacterium]|jgi:hypothetical protein|nr:hypothetical protein [Oscillospiraceae bacterium]
MKRNFALLLIALLALLSGALFGCGSGGGQETTASAPASSSEAPPGVPVETQPDAAPSGDATAEPVSPSDTSPPPTEDAPLPTDTKSMLETIVAGADALLADEDKVGMTFTDPVTADNCRGMLGLTEDEFQKYVVGAYTSNAAIISIAHEVALIECANADDAAQVKALVAKGFDSLRWICAFPDRSLAVESDKYVLLAASSAKYCDAIVSSFTAELGDAAGQADIFYTKPE